MTLPVKIVWGMVEISSHYLEQSAALLTHLFNIQFPIYCSVFSERELMFMFAICRRPSVCLSVTFVHPTQPIEVFGSVSAPFNTLVTWRHPGKILRRSSQGNPSVGRLNQRVVEKCSDFGPFRSYMSETVQDRR